MSSTGLSIGEIVKRTGVAEPTLRMWERRHGFPRPARTPSGHRRYDEVQLDQVRRVVEARRAGLSLSAAIERAQRDTDERELSLFAAVRRLTGAEPRLVAKPVLVSFSHALEDECMARPEPRVIFGAFQRERFYAPARPRWRELSEGAVTAVFADFTHPSEPEGAPAQIPIEATPALRREWAIISFARTSSICLTAREPAGSSTETTPQDRSFELVWSVDPEVARALTQICCRAAADAVPATVQRAQQILATETGGQMADSMGMLTAVLTRTLAGLT